MFGPPPPPKKTSFFLMQIFFFLPLIYRFLYRPHLAFALASSSIKGELSSPLFLSPLFVCGFGIGIILRALSLSLSLSFCRSPVLCTGRSAPYSFILYLLCALLGLLDL